MYVPGVVEWMTVGLVGLVVEGEVHEAGCGEEQIHQDLVVGITAALKGQADFF